MAFDLPAIARSTRRSRRRSVTLREVNPPVGMASDLYRQCYQPVVALWREALPSILGEYERTLAAMTQDSPADAQAQIDGVGEAFNRLLLTLTPSLRNWAVRLDRVIASRWRGAVLSATGVDLQTLIGPAATRETLESAIARNVALIRDVSAQAQGRISDAVFRGLNTRQPAREVAAELRKAVTMARDRSVRIASHQLSAVSASLAEERQREAGIEQVIWMSSHKAHPRPHHAARDGKRYYLATKKAVDGSETVPAGDWVRQPPNCGCTSRAWIDLLDE